MTTQAWVGRITRAAIASHNLEEEMVHESTDLAVKTSKASSLTPIKNPDTSYQLDRAPHLVALWEEFKERHARQAEDEKWLELFKAKVAAAAGDRTELYIGDDLVASYRREGQFPFKRFCEENPHIAAEYTREVTEEKFDVAAFKKDHPALYEANRARALRLK